MKRILLTLLASNAAHCNRGIATIATSVRVRRSVLGIDTPLSYTSKSACHCQIGVCSSLSLRKIDFFLQRRTMASEGRNVDLTYEDIISLKSKNEITLVDVREHSEIQETGKLPDSIHIPLGEVPAALQGSEEEFQSKYGCTKPGKNTELVFSCKMGGRSRKALNTALELGFKNSRHYAGGFLDWQEKTK